MCLNTFQKYGLKFNVYTSIAGEWRQQSFSTTFVMKVKVESSLDFLTSLLSIPAFFRSGMRMT